MEAWWSACEYADKNSAPHIRSSQVQTRALPNRQATIIQTKSYQTLSYVNRTCDQLTPLRVPPNRKCLFSLHLDAIHVYHCFPIVGDASLFFLVLH